MSKNQRTTIMDLGNRFWNFGQKYGVWYVVPFLSGLLVTLATKYLVRQPSDIIGWFFLILAFLVGLLTYAIIAMHRELEKNLQSAGVGQTASLLGVSGVTAHWRDYFNFEEPYGKIIRDRLENMKGPATWYLVSVNPAGFMTTEWINILTAGVEKQGVTVKWVYHTPKILEENEPLRAMWQMFHPQYYWLKGRQEEMDNLSIKIRELHYLVENSQTEIQAKTKTDRMRTGHWELYESRVPHFYMTFLSVPGKYREFHAQEAAPEGTFGFVHLYLMFSGGYDLRPAISLDTRGPILNYYYWSAIRLFNEGVEQGFLQPVKLAAKSVEAG